MRAALAVVVVAAACGGGSHPTTTLTNEAPPVAETWTMQRALAALPPDAALVMRLDLEAVRRSAVLGSFLGEIQREMLGHYTGACADLAAIDVEVLIAMSGDKDTGHLIVWLLDTPTVNLRNCLEQAQTAPPGGVTIKVDGDFTAITPTAAEPQRGGVVILDDHTAVMMFRRAAIDRADVMAATATRNDAAHFPELDGLVAARAPIWGFGAGNAPIFSTFPNRFRTAAVTVGLADRMTVDANVRMIEADQAASVAASVKQQAPMILGMGFVEALDATAKADTLNVHVELSKTSIEKMLSMFSSFLGGGASGGPPPPPTP